MMDNKYIELFKLISQNVSNLTEKVLEADPEDKNAVSMREDYLNLIDKIKAGEVLNKKDYARLLIGANIVTQSLTKQVAKLNTAIQGYKLDIIPKLQQIMENENDENLPEKLFKISE